MNIISKQVLNYSSRDNNKIQGIVIHIAEGNRDQVYSTFTNEQKSSHYLVNNDGSIWQFVYESDAAWHAGLVVRPASVLTISNPNVNPNLYTIGIENEGMSTVEIPDIQYQTLATLVEDCCTRNNIPLDNIHVFGHRLIRADKTCPGLINTAKVVQMAQAIRGKNTQQIVIMQQEISLLQRLINLFKQWYNK